VLEFEAIGPGPFAAMMLADMGADVLLVDRPSGSDLGLGHQRRHEVMLRGRRSVTLDLKSANGAAAALSLAERADAIVEGFRPGVMERLGLGPEVLLAANPKLVYGRMTGWGQAGPLADASGHDINYIAITGALAAIGEAGRGPVPPLNLVGDYGGGSLFLVMGILAALTEARISGRGQVVDAAITDGTIALMATAVGQYQRGMFRDQRGSNMLDGGSMPWYGIYETADSGYISIGPIEPQFFAELCEMIDLPQSLRDSQHDRSRHPQLRAELARIFRTRTRDEWASIAAARDVCLAPILTLGEAMNHPHNVARSAFVNVQGVTHPAPAPRFSRTPGGIQAPPATDFSSMAAVLERWTDNTR